MALSSVSRRRCAEAWVNGKLSIVKTPAAHARQYTPFNFLLRARPASRSRSVMRWMADYMVRQRKKSVGRAALVDARAWHQILGFLWRDETPAPAQCPDLPTLSILESVQWGVMRSGPSFQPELVVGIKGNPGRRLSHNQSDGGSFVLQAGGEPFLIDPGYYQPNGIAHSLPSMDRAWPSASGLVTLKGWEQGGLREITVDATRAYGPARPRRVRRHLVMSGDRALVILDDLVPAQGKPGKISTYFQCGGKAAVDPEGTSVRLSGERHDLWLQTFGPGLKFTLKGPVPFGGSWIFKSMGVKWYMLSGAYGADPGHPLVTVLTPVARGGKRPPVTVERAGQTIRIKLPDGQAVRFEQSDAGWAMYRAEKKVSTPASE